MQHIHIVRADRRSVDALAACDFSFEVRQELQPPFDAFSLERVRTLASPYRKSYGFSRAELLKALDDSERAVFFAKKEEEAIGYLIVSRCWSGFAIIDDIAVDSRYRGRGVARRLMDQALAWTRDGGMPGVRLETQSNNVGACCFYARSGFVLGGHDRCLYQALHPGTREVALFWYLLFDRPTAEYVSECQT